MAELEPKPAHAFEPAHDAEASPEQERLRHAERAFELGDYRELGAVLESLHNPRSPVVAQRAQELERARSIDPLALVVLLLCVLILLATSLYYFWL